MQNIRTILVATDLSEFSGRAGTRAAMLCASLNWDAVELLNVKEGGLPNALGLVLKKTPAVAEVTLAERAIRELRLICNLLQTIIAFFAPVRSSLGDRRRKSLPEQMNWLRD